MEKLFLFAKRFVLQLIVIVFVFSGRRVNRYKRHCTGAFNDSFPLHGKIVDNLKQG